MAFIGNTPTTQAFTPAVDYFSGNGSTTAFTLSRPVASVAQVQVTIDNVAQNPSSAYTVSANTITFTSAPLSGTNNIYVYYTSPITQVIAPGQGTVTSDSFGTITNFTTTGNTTLGDATTDTLTVGVTGIVKDSSGNVGIGTASPASLLHVAGNIRTSSGANYAQFANNFLRSNASGSFFYDNATVGQSNEFRTSVSSSLDTTALTLTASGILALRNAATNATGIGITFPATQSASSDANTLDDYEEGTWTPSVGGTATYSTRSGRYVKIGNAVSIYGTVGISAIGTGSTNIISGLPFSSGSECCIPVDKSQGISTAITWMALRTAGADLYAVTRTAASVSGTINATFMTSGTEVQFAGTYII